MKKLKLYPYLSMDRYKADNQPRSHTYQKPTLSVPRRSLLGTVKKMLKL